MTILIKFISEKELNILILIDIDNQESQFSSYLNYAVSLLANKKYQDFIDFFDESDLNVEELVLALKYMDNSRPICLIDNPNNSNCIRGIFKYNNGSGYAVDYDLMSNGKSNDLTLQVEFIIDGNNYSVCLEGLHTL